MKLGMQVGLLGHLVLDGDPALPPPTGHSPQFSAHICCGQMARWIKMSLGMEVGHGPGDFVLDGDPSPPSPNRGQSPPNFWHVHCSHMAGWIKTALGTEMGVGPGHIVLDGDPASLPPQKKTARGIPPKFSAISIVAKRLHASRCHLVCR